ncbi:TIGR04222 domain-containing membrane protein, partial [Actinoplanes sp. NPDC051633]|uniref:TIGR04222 domain-containing membrane protein n=1 Tax=Actinoplanes sp. NPDC051633 TaxID=3155670 RepID=UPI00341C6D27
RNAVYASLAGLRAAGAVTSSSDRTLSQLGAMPAGATPLDAAVYNAAGRHVRARDLPGDQWLARALADLRKELEGNGLVIPRRRRLRVRLWVLPLAALAVVGFVRAIDGWDNDQPSNYIFLLAVLTLGAVIFAWIQSGDRQSRAAKRAVAGVRRSHAHLEPDRSPSFQTYGVTGAAMSAALWGGLSLHMLDPAFAAEAEIEKYDPGWIHSTGAGTAWGSGSSCSSGSSCGGGGGGGGCGGGGGGS